MHSHTKLIVEWANERGIIKGSTPEKQFIKLTEELGELAAGMARGMEGKISDSIGDCVVVLTILAAQYGMDIDMCVAYAYEEIKERKGVMRQGVFVKEEDLER